MIESLRICRYTRIVGYRVYAGNLPDSNHEWLTNVVDEVDGEMLW